MCAFRREPPDRHKMKRRHFRGDAAFANPEVHELLEAEGYKYTIRLPANSEEGSRLSPARGMRASGTFINIVRPRHPDTAPRRVFLWQRGVHGMLVLRPINSFIVLAFTILLQANPVAAEGVTFDVDLELILAVDVSNSMSTEDLRLQREGYVSAFRDPSVASAIASGEIGRIAILYLEWAGPNHFQILRPWTVLTSPKDSAAFADALATDPLAEHSPASNRAMSFGKSLDPPPIATATATSISASLLFALEMFGDRRLRTDRQVIDVSGNGKNNAGPLLAPVRDLLVSRGIVINGLPITWSAEESGDSPTSFGETFLGRYFEDCVIGGPGAFSIAANDISRFPQAVRRKLLMEIVDRTILVTPARFEAPTRARVDCSIERGER